MRAGALRHRVQIQNYVEGVDEIGQPFYGWETVATVWAAVEPLQGREFFAAQTAFSETTTRIRMRYRPGITTTMRILFEGAFYNVQSVIEPHTRRRELQLMCKSGVNDG